MWDGRQVGPDEPRKELIEAEPRTLRGSIYPGSGSNRESVPVGEMVAECLNGDAMPCLGFWGLPLLEGGGAIRACACSTTYVLEGMVK